MQRACLALLKVRAAMKHGDFKKWWLENNFHRPAFLLHAASLRKVARAKQKQRSLFRLSGQGCQKRYERFLALLQQPQAGAAG